MVCLVSVVDAPLLDPGVEGEGGAGLSRVAPVRGLRPLILTTHSENTVTAQLDCTKRGKRGEEIRQRRL